MAVVKPMTGADLNDWVRLLDVAIESEAGKEFRQRPMHEQAMALLAMGILLAKEAGITPDSLKASFLTLADAPLEPAAKAAKA